MSEHPVTDACQQRDLRVLHVGYRAQEVRLFLGPVDGDGAEYVVELHGVHSFFDRGLCNGQAVLLEAIPGVGSFGWDILQYERFRYTEVFLKRKADPTTNPFRAIVQRVVERLVRNAAEQGWPG